jgi:hypothetical protein
VRRQFESKFGKEPPPVRTLRDWKQRFLETLSVLPRPYGGDQSARRLSEEKREEIVKAFGDCPTTSQRKVSQAVGVSLGMVNKVLHEEGIRPWKFTRVQEIFARDEVDRLRFCDTVLAKQERDVNFVFNIAFSDEATFHLNGSVNTHNQFYYSTSNQFAAIQEPLKSPGVWALVSGSKLSTAQ